MRAQVRIVSGELKGRKLTCFVTPDLRPTPDRVRGALFSILGNAIPGRVFVDIFAGTGVVGVEALSRGASQALFIERDARLAGDIDNHLRTFKLTSMGRVFRTDAYRWASNWQAPGEPVNVFVSPPFADLHEHPELLVQLTADLQRTVAEESVLALQAETHAPLEEHPHFQDWERRRYGRNLLMLWQKEGPAQAQPTPS